MVGTEKLQDPYTVHPSNGLQSKLRTVTVFISGKRNRVGFICVFNQTACVISIERVTRDAIRVNNFPALIIIKISING